MASRWTINSSDGGSKGSDLIGCVIVKIPTGYQIFDSKGKLLASTTDKIPPFEFPTFKYKDLEWTISVELAANSATGSWENKKPRITGEEGSWSAGATEDPKSHVNARAAKKKSAASSK